jgi:hypothetical protein
VNKQGKEKDKTRVEVNKNKAFAAHNKTLTKQKSKILNKSF